MRAVVQRVSYSKVLVDGQASGQIERGILVFLGVGKGDEDKDAQYLAEKILNLRIFEDDNNKMNKSVVDINGEILVVSQFTLYGDCRKGNRPSFDAADSPQNANRLYLYFIDLCKTSGLNIQTGVFKAMMDVQIHNDGPVTLLLDSKKEF